MEKVGLIVVFFFLFFLLNTFERCFESWKLFKRNDKGAKGVHLEGGGFRDNTMEGSATLKFCISI